MIEHQIPKGYEGKGGTRAAVLAKSIANDITITTFLVDFPRFILAELNTHRCIAGDSKLNFDLPCGTTKSRKRVYSMAIEEFCRKWSEGSLVHTTPSLKSICLDSVEDSTVYSAKELSKLLNISVSNIRTVCRNGRLEVENPLKTRSEDFKILGSSFKTFRLTKCVRTFPLVEKLKAMNLRMYNPDTRQIEHTHVTDCWAVGEKPTFKLTTITGETISATHDHLIFTDKGWKALEDITVNDSVIVPKSHKESKKHPSSLKKINGEWTQTWNRKTLPTLAEMQGNKCFTCQEAKPLEVHHVIPVHVDSSKAFDINNVIAVCEYCHKNVHHKVQGWQEGSPLQPVFTKVASIEEAGVQTVYDLSVESPHQNFSANGIIVHNCISKNGASSRAIPVAQQIKRVQDNPVVPIHFGLNQAGMSADTEVDENTKSKGVYEWLFNANRSVVGAQILQGMGVHKQVVNRIMEPYSFMRMVVTATEWDNFFWLRLHKDADPHIAELARVMLHAYQQTPAVVLTEDCWHTPFFAQGFWSPLVENAHGITAQEAIEHSMSCCAQTSYRKLDMSTEKTEAIVERLFNGERVHASPSEHIAKPLAAVTADAADSIPNWDDFHAFQNEITHVDMKGNCWSNNFKGWYQYRQGINNNVCTDFDFQTLLDTSDIKSGIDMV